MQTTLKLQSLPFYSTKTYLTATLFIIGNIVLPQVFHLIPQGGVAWLPIYFFTLIGAYTFGWRVGILTAIVSPILSTFIFGMPTVYALPIILLKSVLLAIIAGYIANRFKKVSIILLFVIVTSYQIIGTLGEWTITGDFQLACHSLRLGIPGMMFQIFGGYAVINYLIRK